MINEYQFDLLRYLLKEENGKKTQREIASDLKISVGKVNSVINELKQAELIDEKNGVTSKGLSKMEPYKVTNAIIMAAGLSSRFVPLSFDKPKGLAVVKDEVLIEREIRQLREAGIEKIYVVVGYMKELFFYLQEDFDVQFILNNEFATRNNNGSIYLARHILDNSYICSSDDYFVNNPFEQYVYKSYYAVEYMEGESGERGAVIDKNGRIIETYPGAKDDWALLGHVYWNREFSKAFVNKLETIYELETTKPLLWERVFDKFLWELPPLYARKYNKDIYEFDSLEELLEFDPFFMQNMDSMVFDNICSVLNCSKEDLSNFEVMKAGQTNNTCTFEYKGEKYVYRHCSTFTREIVNREREAAIQKLISDSEIDSSCIYLDPIMGWKISKFIEGKQLDFDNEEDLKKAISILHKVHDISTDGLQWKFDFWKEITRVKSLTRSITRSYDDYEKKLHNTIQQLYQLVVEDNWGEHLCHNDVNAGNYLGDENGWVLIDWEYAGKNDIGYDIAKLVLKAEAKGERARDIINMYFGRECTLEEERHVIACGAIEDYYWLLWAIYLELNGRNLGESVGVWYKHAVDYSAIALKLYNK